MNTKKYELSYSSFIISFRICAWNSVFMWLNTLVATWLVNNIFQFQPPKKDAKSSAKQPQKTQKKKEGSGGGKAKKKVRHSVTVISEVMFHMYLEAFSWFACFLRSFLSIYQDSDLYRVLHKSHSPFPRTITVGAPNLPNQPTNLFWLTEVVTKWLQTQLPWLLWE